MSKGLLKLCAGVVVAGLVAGPSWSQDAGRPRAVTLQEAIRIALERNPLVAQAESRIEAAEARVGQTRSGRGPQISAGGSWTYQGPNPTITFPGEPGQPPQTVSLGVPRTRSARVTGVQPLDVAGKVRTATEAARFGARAQRQNLAQTENSLVFDVQNAYYNVLRSNEIVRVARESVSAAEEHRRVAEAQFRQGAAPEFDVLRATVEVANLQQRLVAAEAASQQALIALKNVMGVEPALSVDVVPLPSTGGASTAPPPVVPVAPAPTPTPETAPTETPEAAPGAESTSATSPAPEGAPAPEAAPSPAAPAEEPKAGAMAPASPTEVPLTASLPELDVTALLEEAYRTRPELLQADESVRQAEATVRLQKKGNLPDLNVSGNYFINPDAAGFRPITESWNLGANLTWSIFDSGLTRERVREARSNLALAREAREQIRQTVGADVQTAVVNLRDAAQRQTTARANVIQAREALRIARVRYENGVSTGVEVTDAELALTQAETNAVNADYDYLVAQARLDRALGRLVAVARDVREGGRP